MKNLIPKPKKDEKKQKKKAIKKSSGKLYALPVKYNVKEKADERAGLLGKQK